MLRARPTSRAISVLVMCAALVAGGLVFGSPTLVVAAAVLAALVAFSWLWVLAPRRSGEASRGFSPALPQAGQDVRVALTLTQTVPRIRAGVWHDTMPAGLAAAPALEIRPQPRGTALIDAEYTASAVARGEFAVGPVSVTTGDALGMFTRRLSLGATTPVLIGPPIVPLQSMPPVAHHSRSTAEQSSQAASAHGADSLTPRDYVSGDSMRRVHWRASAHRGSLMVRQEDRLDSPEATIVLCTRGVAGDAFELAVSAAASVARRLAATDWRVHVFDTLGTELGGTDLARVSPDTTAAITSRGQHGATEIFIAADLSTAEAERLQPPPGGVGIALVATDNQAVAGALAAGGWRFGSIATSVAEGWAEACGARLP